MTTTVDSLEQTIQDYIDECAAHEQCVECPCIEFCSRFDYSDGNAAVAPAFWYIRGRYKGIPC